ncbi:hypothetical protein VitviT2T_007530 [Vitis vinifera]|uniref:Peroxidase n=2 Tax=Vitis vinifera TaxID=29760 RepID=A0ABY9C1W0_VITVI
MRRERCILFSLLALTALVVSLVTVEAAETLPETKLTWHYYKLNTTCRYAEAYVRSQVKFYWNELKDGSIAPKLLRLLYSDCFVNGCDASILLDGPNSEKTASQNRGLGGFALIDKIKTVLESRKECKGVVSCADILNLATRDAVHLAGAPSYPVLTGRKDGFESNAASVDLPSPSISWESALAYFKSKGLDVLDLGTLLGAHTLGRTHCSYIENRLYNFNGTNKPDPSMDTSFLAEMKKKCPQRVKKGQSDPLVFLNPESGSSHNFTNSYYSRILSHKAVLGVDQQLLFGDDTEQITEEFAAGFEDFRRSFALSMSRMGNLQVLTGSQGEIRENCRVRNN